MYWQTKEEDEGNGNDMVWEAEPNHMAGHYWVQMHDQFVAQSVAKHKAINIVFMGASIVQYWRQEGQHLWDTYYAPKGAVNYGICGDTIQNVLWRVTHRAIDSLTPRVLVLQCGANNMVAFGRPNEKDISLGIGNLITEIRSKLPDTKIISIGLMSLSQPMFTKKAKRINDMIAKYADDVNVFFVDLIPHMTDDNGQQKSELFTDGLHLSARGYDLWHEHMWPIIHKLL